MTGVWLRHRYADLPVLGVAATDLAALDLAVRRAAYATSRGRSARMFTEHDVRIPLRLGLRLRGNREGSLESLIDVPAWIVAVLGSAPATALINLVTMLSWREAIRVQLRQLVLTDDEEQVLRDAARAAPPVPEPEQVAGPAHPRELPAGQRRTPEFVDPASSAVPAQGVLPDPLAERLASTEPVVDVDIGDVHIRGLRPDIEVAVQQGDRITAVSVRKPRR